MRHLIIEAIENVQILNIDNDVMVIRALNSHEMHIGEMGSFALDRLGLSLSAVYDCTYLPSIIYKTRKIPSIKSFNAVERKATLAGVYDFNAKEFEEFTKVLIIDDVVTTGATACAIIQPILEAYPKTEMTVFALAWTPTQKQQEYIHEMERKKQMLNEPEPTYGSGKKWVDEDFEGGETDITF